MAGTLSVRTIFGVKGNVSNNIACLEDGVIIYPAANYLVRYSSYNKNSEITPLSENSTGITAMALSMNRRYIAVAETAINENDGHIITIYNTKTLSKRKQFITGTDIRLTTTSPNIPIRNIAFTGDDMNIIAITHDMVGVMSIDKAKVVAVSPLSVHTGTNAPAAAIRPLGISGSPTNHSKFVVWGVNLYAYYSIQESPSPTSTPFPNVLVPIPSSPAFLDYVAPFIENLEEILQHQAASAQALNTNNTTSATSPVKTNSMPNLSSPGSSLVRQNSMQALNSGHNSPGNHSVIPGLPGSPGMNIGDGTLPAPGIIFTAQVWLNEKDHNVVATRQGALLLFQRESFLSILPSSPKDGRAIDILCSTPKGFLSAGEGGNIRLYETAPTIDETAPRTASRNGRRSANNRRSASRRSTTNNDILNDSTLIDNEVEDAEDEEEIVEDLGPYLCVRTLQATIPGLESEDRIRSMSISSSGNTGVFTLAGTQLLQLDIANANVKDDITAFTPIGSPSHAPSVGQSCYPGGPSDMCSIVAMSTAVRKPFIATLGIDGSIRVWNYIEKSLEIVKYFPEGATSIGLHPSGLLAVIGFQDRLRLMTVTIDDFKEIRQYPVKGCQEVRFSRGGHLFAAVHGNVILLYSAYTGEYLQTLRGHNGRITSINWSYNDANLLSVAADGAIYEWDMRDGKRSREFMLKGAKFWSAAPNKDGSILYTVGDGGLVASDGSYGGSTPTLREIDMNTGAVLHEWELAGHASNIILSTSNPRMLFTGGADYTKPAMVKAYPVPLPSSGGLTSNDFIGTSCSVAKMAMSHDDAYLFVAGADGCLIVYDVRDSQGRVPISEASVKLPWAEETVITIADLEERKTNVRELRDNVSELQSNASYNLRMKDMNYEEAMKRLKERASTEIEQLRQQADLLSEEKEDSEREFQQQLAVAENRHRNEMQKRENMYQTKIMDEVEKYQGLQAEVASTTAAWRSKRAAAIDKHASMINSLTNAYERELNKVRDKREGLAKDVEGARTDWTEMKAQMENDLDDEATGTRKAYQDRLDIEREQALKFKGENGIMKKKFASLQRDIEDNKEAMGNAVERQNGLRKVIEGLEKEIAVLRSQIYDRDLTIGDKEKRIYELKKKNQELEKFKFVLDYKIKELKGQIEPREAEIAALRAQIKEVDAELEAYHKSNSDLDTKIGEYRKSLDSLQSQASNLRMDVNKRSTLIRNFGAELFQAVQKAILPAEYVVAIEELYKSYVPADLPPGAGDITVITESERQREHLETLGSKLKVKLREESKHNKVENARLVEENLALINQIKSLREAIQVLRNHIKNVDVEKARHSHSMAARTLAASSAAQRSLSSMGGMGNDLNTSLRGSPQGSLIANERYSPNQHPQSSNSPQQLGLEIGFSNLRPSTSTSPHSTSPKRSSSTSPLSRSPNTAAIPHPIHTVTHDLVQNIEAPVEETKAVPEEPVVTAEPVVVAVEEESKAAEPAPEPEAPAEASTEATEAVPEATTTEAAETTTTAEAVAETTISEVAPEETAAETTA